MTMIVSDLMTPFPVTVALRTPIDRCALLMAHHGFRHLPVVGADGKLAGVVLDATLNRCGAVFSNEYVPFDLADSWRCAEDLAEAPDVVARPEDDLSNTLRAVQRTRQDFVVVVDEGERPVGLLTEHDLLKVALDVVPKELTVEQVAVATLVSFDSDESGIAGLKAMRDRGIRHLVLTEDGRFIGVVSWRDLVAEDVERQPDVTLRAAMRSTQPITVAPGTTLVDCARKLLEARIGCLPVVDKGRAVRIVTRRDVIDLAATGLESEDLFGDRMG